MSATAYTDRVAATGSGNPLRSLSAEEYRRVKRRARQIDARSRCAFSNSLVQLYGVRAFRGAVIDLAMKLEGGRYFSRTLREISRVHHDVQVGMYTYGRSTLPGYYPPGSSVGNFGSIGTTLVSHRLPSGCPAQHPLFHDPKLGLVAEKSSSYVARPPIEVGHDVYSGFDVITLPTCRRIGDGAVIGTSAVLTEDVPPYSIVAGFPARVIRKRFSEEVEALVRESEWFLRPISELVEEFDCFINPASVQMMNRLVSVMSRPPSPIEAAAS